MEQKYKCLKCGFKFKLSEIKDKKLAFVYINRLALECPKCDWCSFTKG